MGDIQNHSAPKILYTYIWDDSMRIGLFGVPGVNRGDEAITLSLIDGFKEICPNASFLVATLSKNFVPARPSVSLFKINRRSAWGYIQLVWSIASVDLVILGGGSLIQDKMGGSRIKGVLGYAWTVTLIAKILRKKVITAPIGIDELTSSEGKAAAREVLDRTTYLAVRDTLSKKIGFELIANDLAPQVFCDPVFGWDPEIDDAVKAPSDCIVLAPAFEGAQDDNVARLFADIIEQLIVAFPGSRICLIAMDDRPSEDQGKLRLIHSLLTRQQNEMVIDFVPRNAFEARKCILDSQGVIAMRLHAIIIAYANVPVFCISRTTKTEALIAEYDVDGVKIGTLTNTEIVDQACRSLKVDKLEAQIIRRTELRARLKSYYSAAMTGGGM
jgi:polysaccharide pyruvyl transferase WcaK-like protein